MKLDLKLEPEEEIWYEEYTNWGFANDHRKNIDKTLLSVVALKEAQIKDFFDWDRK